MKFKFCDTTSANAIHTKLNACNHSKICITIKIYTILYRLAGKLLKVLYLGRERDK